MAIWLIEISQMALNKLIIDLSVNYAIRKNALEQDTWNNFMYSRGFLVRDLYSFVSLYKNTWPENAVINQSQSSIPEDCLLSINIHCILLNWTHASLSMNETKQQLRNWKPRTWTLDVWISESQWG